MIGLGLYEFYLNGEKQGDECLLPGFCDYDSWMQYQTWELQLETGKNKVELVLGDGWYHQSQLMEGGGIYGTPCLLLQLEITYKSGVKQYVVSDCGWKVCESPITMNNVYVGETWDGRAIRLSR